MKPSLKTLERLVKVTNETFGRSFSIEDGLDENNVRIVDNSYLGTIIITDCILRPYFKFSPSFEIVDGHLCLNFDLK